MIESIFKTYPAVRKKHVQCVPAEMTESAFWTKFFQSHYFHRDRLPVLKDLFSDCAKADDKEMRKELDKVKLSHIDMMATLEETESVTGDGFLKDTEAQVNDSKDKDAVTPQGIYRNMIKRFNHHSIMVLKACDRPENQTITNLPPPNPAANGNNGSNNNPPPSTVQPPQQQDNNNDTQQPLTKKKKKKRDRDKEKEELLENGDAELYAIPPEAKKV